MEGQQRVGAQWPLSRSPAVLPSSSMSSFNMLRLAVVGAAGELQVVVCLLLFKHHDLPQKIHTYRLEQ